jgi:preprotein translocase subunit SecY
MSLITLPGSVFLALLAVLPAIVVKLMDVQAGWALFYGGTSLLIMVGVDLDTMSQIEGHLKMHHHEGLTKGGKLRSRNL